MLVGGMVTLGDGARLPDIQRFVPSRVKSRSATMSVHDPETMLFDAISSGNMYRVKQLIGSGISKNTVLHSPIRWEGATVLATAAYTGNLDIVHFLVQAGTSVNFKDPCLHRNALHWACMGQGDEVVRYLVGHGADINSRDRDNVTPIIQAAMHKNYRAVGALVELGADVNQVDRLRCSTLHYASFHGDSRSVERLIQAGCLSNNATVLGKGTPLANLIHHKDYGNCRLLLDAGYKLGNETLIDVAIEKKDIEVLLSECLRMPMSLKGQCRLVIRNAIKGPFYEKKIYTLPIPFKLKTYMSLKQ